MQTWFKLERHTNSNSFSVLSERPDENDKENMPLKRNRKPTYKVAETLDIGVEALSTKKKAGINGVSSSQS